jgi:hydroxyethylthiazole kinase-like uncharacterized protein yjeF
MGCLPAWLDPLPDAAAMRAIDRWAIDERDVPSLDLMERAGHAVASAVEDLAPDGPVCVLCGKGNNGGDGLVAARLLREAGRPVTVLLVGGQPADLLGDARENLLRLPGEPPLLFGLGAALPESAAVVDALLGTGFAGAPHGPVAAAIDAIDASPAPVVCVDVPSGVDASTGVVASRAVHATTTVTFHTAKPGLRIHPGKAHAGDVRVVDIGIPRGGPPADRGPGVSGVAAGEGGARAAAGDRGARAGAAAGESKDAAAPAIGLILPAVLDLLPHRGARSTKFSSGHVLVAGGSRGLTGAPRLAAAGAMRAGAGYVTACVPASQQPVVASAAAPELMTRALREADDDGSIGQDAAPGVLDAATHGGALVLGPGLGRAPSALAFARILAREAPLPLVLDADGLNAHAGGHLDALAARTAPTILTPHAGELARLLDGSSADIERERLHHVLAAAARARAIVLLKGDDTLIAHPDGRVAVSPGASPALATAGSGDVLSGILGALLAAGVDPFAAAAAAVLLHVFAGRLAAAAPGASADTVLASDVIAALPAARLVRGQD